MNEWGDVDLSKQDVKKPSHTRVDHTYYIYHMTHWDNRDVEKKPMGKRVGDITFVEGSQTVYLNQRPGNNAIPLSLEDTSGCGVGDAKRTGIATRWSLKRLAITAMSGKPRRSLGLYLRR